MPRPHISSHSSFTIDLPAQDSGGNQCHRGWEQAWRECGSPSGNTENWRVAQQLAYERREHATPNALVIDQRSED